MPKNNPMGEPTDEEPVKRPPTPQGQPVEEKPEPSEPKQDDDQPADDGC